MYGMYRIRAWKVLRLAIGFYIIFWLSVLFRVIIIPDNDLLAVSLSGSYLSMSASFMLFRSLEPCQI